MEKVQYIICLLFIIRTAFCQSTTVGDICLTPSAENGYCINMKQCPQLRFLLENQRKNATIAAYLRNSLCQYKGKDVIVCCPLEKYEITTTEYVPIEKTTSTDQPVIQDNHQTTVNSSELPSINTCGKSNNKPNRIVGGHPAELGAWPWMTAIGYTSYYNRKSGEYDWLCGGTLISDRYVITAAHCTVGKILETSKLVVVRLGDLDLDKKVLDGASPIEVPVASVITHERYNPRKFVNDIALLKLENTVSFNDFIQPVCLPILPEHKSNSFVNIRPFVTGWGKTAYYGESATTALMEIQIPVVDNMDCKKAYIEKPTTIDDTVLCAGLLAGGKDSCGGDSGGPLMMPGGSRQFYLIGVVSYGHKCAEPGYPGVYTRVTSFVEWITENINNS